jgi:hypothetical protein
MQVPQAWPPDLALRATLALQRDFLTQRQRKILESREGDIRVKSLGTGQQMITCRVKALKTLHDNERRLCHCH